MGRLSWVGVICLFLTPAVCPATTLHVPDQFPTIQDGIDNAESGDTVLVACGTYEEGGIAMKSGVCLRSETGSPDCVTIDAETSLREAIFCISVDNTASVEGFTLTGGVADFGAGMYCVSSSLTISDCIFEGNVGEFGIGLYCELSNPTVLRCTFRDNEAADGAGGGMACVVGSSPTIMECTFSDNAAYFHGGGGLYVYNNSSPTVTHCVFSGNWGDFYGGGVLVELASHPTFNNCTVSGNAVGLAGGGMSALSGSSLTLENCIIAFSTLGEAVSCDGTSSATLTCSDVYGNVGGDWTGCISGQEGTNGNISEDPLFCFADCGDFHIEEGSPCAPFSEPNPECDLIGAQGVGCVYEPRAWRVPGEVSSIQAAIDSAGCADTVLVDCGTYNEHDIVMRSGVIVRSETGLPDCVTVDAQGQGRVFSCVQVDHTALIEGITITGGHITGSHWPVDSGAGLYCFDSSIRVVGCLFAGNSAQGGGAGVACEGSDPTVTDCTFSENTSNFGAGIACRNFSHPNVSGCAFSGNQAGSLGGGVYAATNSSPPLTDCVFSENTAIDGGGFYCQDECGSVLTRCTFDSNVAPFGGGMRAWLSSPILRSCTFYGNEAEAEGSGIFCQGSFLRLHNSILAFGADGMAIYCDPFSEPLCSPTLECCDIFGNQGGDWVGCIAGQAGIDGNFSADPLFCDPPSGDLSLFGSSPCLPGNHPDGADCGLIGAHDQGCQVDSAPDVPGTLGTTLSLTVPAPNPSSGILRYGISLPEAKRARVSLFSVSGRLIRILLDRDLAPGDHALSWNPAGHNGRRLSSGVYYLRLEAGGRSETQRVIVAR